MAPNTAGAQGFTLIEVLIALAITAIVATISFTSLSAVIAGVEASRVHTDRTREINRAWQIISRDIRAFVPRPVRDEFGASVAALSGGEQAEYVLSLTRAGWFNPNEVLRSTLQRVRYRFEDNALWRENFLVLDRSTASVPQRVKLLDGVTAVTVAFLSPEVDIGGTELDTSRWPDSWGLRRSSQDQLVAPPQALELRLELEGWGEMRRLYELP